MIKTYTHKMVDVFNPKPEMFCIEDIAHSLSMQCRFGGHLKYHYSVAEHSIMCSMILKKKDKISGLMHDCSEAYLMDFSKPIKDKIPEYLEIEHNLMIVLSSVFNFEYPLSENIKNIDKDMLDFELNYLFEMESRSFLSLSQIEAEKMFLEEYRKLH